MMEATTAKGLITDQVNEMKYGRKLIEFFKIFCNFISRTLYPNYGTGLPILNFLDYSSYS